MGAGMSLGGEGGREWTVYELRTVRCDDGKFISTFWYGIAGGGGLQPCRRLQGPVGRCAYLNCVDVRGCGYSTRYDTRYDTGTLQSWQRCGYWLVHYIVTMSCRTAWSKACFSLGSNTWSKQGRQ